MEGQLSIFDFMDSTDNKPNIGSVIWSVSGCKLTRLLVISKQSSVSPDYFVAKDKDRNIFHINKNTLHKWWDYTREAAKNCKFADILN